MTTAPTVSVSVSGSTIHVNWTAVNNARDYTVRLFTPSGYAADQPSREIWNNVVNKLDLTGVSNGTYYVTVAAESTFAGQSGASEANGAWKISDAVSVTVWSSGGSAQTKWLNGVPYWLQGDSRWSGIYIGTKTIGQVGCTTTCLAMTESYRTGTTITPADMRYRLSYSNNDIIWSSASNYHFYGKSVYSYEEVMRYAYEAINAGKPLIIEGTSSGNTHWVVIVGYVDLNTNNMQTSNFMINDPGNSSRITLADFHNYRGTITSVMSY